VGSGNDLHAPNGGSIRQGDWYNNQTTSTVIKAVKVAAGGGAP
jgi:hypothetical protein